MQHYELPEGGVGGGGDMPPDFPQRGHSDKEITQAVKAALYLDPELREPDFEVSTRSGVVTIAGEVSSEELRRRVIDLVMNLDGVEDVIPDIAVT